MQKQKLTYDPTFLVIVALIISLGFVMVTSASMPVTKSLGLGSFKIAISQAIFIGVAVSIMLLVTHIPIRFYQYLSFWPLIISLFLLAVLIIPGVSRPINGSTRWFLLGPISFQPSELAKLSLIFYIAGYIVRREGKLKESFVGFLIPLCIIGFMGVLLLLEPDFGTTVVSVAIGLGMLFLGGVRITHFLVLLPPIAGAIAYLSTSSPYRLERLISFLNPWADQFDTGYQLVQSLIAFGRGGIFGVGIGESVQKLHYLPKAHTDFILAVIAEELGLIGAAGVLLLFTAFIVKAMLIGRNACLRGKHFGGYLAYGIAIWIGLQALINMSVNIGLLPTKGITLPLMSYGGSSMVLTCIAVGILFRVDFENRIRQ